jgi:hypothetical protein
MQILHLYIILVLLLVNLYKYVTKDNVDLNVTEVIVTGEKMCVYKCTATISTIIRLRLRSILRYVQ